jgi:hypothetical protein
LVHAVRPGRRAWHAKVVARSKGGATIRFLQARTRDGRRYTNAQVPLESIRLLVQ